MTDPIMRLYANILNTRIVRFTEINALRAGSQAGFRPKLSTVHQLFTLQHFIDRHHHTDKPLYCCFLDLKSAYDRVNRILLWEVLRRLGIDGRVLSAVQSLYDECTVSMNIGGKSGQRFTSHTGVKQGCPLSPTLFGLFVDGLHRHLLQRCPAEGPQLRSGQRVPDLGYVDDFVLLASTPEGLQRLIDAAAEFCTQVGMQISSEKTKVLVFGSSLPGPHQWYCDGSPLEWVDKFDYLGITFAATCGLHQTFGKLQKNMWAAWALLQRQFGKLQCSTSVWLLLRVYDVCVPPTASYACELWALRAMSAEHRKARDGMASKHIKILRQIGGVRTAVPTAVLFRELGVRPLPHIWWQRMVKFWNRLAELPASSLHKQAALDDCWDAIVGHVRNWAYSFITGLRSLGYEFLIRCDMMEPVDLPRVLELLKDRDSQRWQNLDVCPRTCPSANAQLCTYERWFAQPQTLRPMCPLLQLPVSAGCLRTLLRFRMGCHGLPNDVGRRRGIPRMQRSCTRCAMPGIADERHLIFECVAFQPVRDRFPTLFGEHITTMQAFMWQDDAVQVAKFVQACFAALTNVGSVGSSHQP